MWIRTILVRLSGAHYLGAALLTTMPEQHIQLGGIDEEALRQDTIPCWGALHRRARQLDGGAQQLDGEEATDLPAHKAPAASFSSGNASPDVEKSEGASSPPS